MQGFWKKKKKNPVYRIYAAGIHHDSYHLSSAYYVPTLSQLPNIYSEA